MLFASCLSESLPRRRTRMDRYFTILFTSEIAKNVTARLLRDDTLGDRRLHRERLPQPPAMICATSSATGKVTCPSSPENSRRKKSINWSRRSKLSPNNEIRIRPVRPALSAQHPPSEGESCPREGRWGMMPPRAWPARGQTVAGRSRRHALRFAETIFSNRAQA